MMTPDTLTPDMIECVEIHDTNGVDVKAHFYFCNGASWSVAIDKETLSKSILFDNIKDIPLSIFKGQTINDIKTMGCKFEVKYYG